MTLTPNIALLGATGKAGQHILQQLLHQGYTVKALVRNPERVAFSHPQLQLITGNAAHYHSVYNLLKDCDGVINALGQTPGQPLISTLCTRHIVTAMQHLGINRYIFLAGLTLDVAGDQKSELNQSKSNWMRQHYPTVVADKQQAFQLLLNTPLAWTMVRLPLLEQTSETRKLVVNVADCPGDIVTAADLALFVVAQLTNGTYIHKSPFVASC